MDAEIVYVDQDGNFLDFQDIDRRQEESAVATSEILKQPKVLVFDILALNDDFLLKTPLKYRKKILAQKLNLEMHIPGIAFD